MAQSRIGYDRPKCVDTIFSGRLIFLALACFGFYAICKNGPVALELHEAILALCTRSRSW